MRSVLIVAAGALVLAACGKREPDPITVVIPAVGGDDAVHASVSCINGGDIGVTSYSELSTPHREKLLTEGALKQGVKVYRNGWAENQYGNVTLTYWDNTGRCFLWAETLTIQEYSVRLGMSPVGISPFYEADTSAPAGGN